MTTRSKGVPSSSLPRLPNAQPRIQTLARTLAFTGSATVTSKYNISVFPDYKGPPTRLGTANKFAKNDYIPTNNFYYFDLIFSVRKKPQFSDSQYNLLKVAIDIPTTTTPPNTTTEALLTANYDGPGLRMIGNQRFIPFLYNLEEEDGQSNGNLHIELVPRSASDDYALLIDDERSLDLGFRLAEANISPVVVTTYVGIDGVQGLQPRGKVTIRMTEWYSTAAFPSGEPVSSTYDLVKYATTDDSL